MANASESGPACRSGCGYSRYRRQCVFMRCFECWLGPPSDGDSCLSDCYTQRNLSMIVGLRPSGYRNKDYKSESVRFTTNATDLRLSQRQRANGQRSLGEADPRHRRLLSRRRSRCCRIYTRNHPVRTHLLILSTALQPQIEERDIGQARVKHADLIYKPLASAGLFVILPLLYWYAQPSRP